MVRRLRQLLMLLLCLWLVLSLVNFFWALYPSADTTVPDKLEIVNPLSQAASGGATRSAVNIEQLQSRHLFGQVDATEPMAAVEQEIAIPEASREGIEKGARETRLQLVLRGAVASTEDGLGHAIIEYQKKQAVYAVEDELPIGNKVVLAKVMRRQVVLDNGGTYELLTLSEENELDAQVQQQVPRIKPSTKAPALVDKRGEQNTTALAQEYRDRLYQNPQSLAEVVSVNAVRQDGELLGYRISPGKDRGQFSQLGFKSGDLVTSVNGIDLNDPANTMRLYQTMRTASEAVFDLQRGEESVSISVSLGAE